MYGKCSRLFIVLLSFKINSLNLLISTGGITNIRTNGAGSLHIDTVSRSIELGISAGECLDKELMRVLNVDEKLGGESTNKEVFGFLK